MKIIKNRPAALLTTAILLLIISISCDGGIEPYPEPLDPGLTGFSGLITFTGDWPEGVTRTHLVVFENTINSYADFFPPNMSFIVDPVPYGATEFEYNSNDNNYENLFEIEPGTYRYIVVAQSSTKEISLSRSDWVVVGIYYNEGDNSTPGSMTIEEGKITADINIVCDFNNPPLQPPSESSQMEPVQ
ncbi:MAG: hypothetical protein PVH88_20180 [Ignavibacteria bacterium]|jgi:hypothetical protein